MAFLTGCWIPANSLLTQWYVFLMSQNLYLVVIFSVWLGHGNCDSWQLRPVGVCSKVRTMLILPWVCKIFMRNVGICR